MLKCCLAQREIWNSDAKTWNNQEDGDLNHQKTLFLSQNEHIERAHQLSITTVTEPLAACVGCLAQKPQSLIWSEVLSLTVPHPQRCCSHTEAWEGKTLQLPPSPESYLSRTRPSSLPEDTVKNKNTSWSVSTHSRQTDIWGWFKWLPSLPKRPVAAHLAWLSPTVQSITL